ncbi:MAG: hypothetical protein IJO59_07685 [Clostridia bacterium]|nr:hypothetical protein [Clostridia bacterium]
MKKLGERQVKTAIAAVTGFFQTKKGVNAVIVCGIVGVLLLALPEWLPPKKEKIATVTSSQEFISETEEKLRTIVSSIQGAGQCRVMITLENGVEYVYATEQKTNTDRQEDSGQDSNKVIQRDDSEEKVIVIDSDNGREGLLVTEIQPTIKGVVIVCEGGDDKTVCERIVQAVTVVLNVSSKRVCVTKLS